MSGARWRSVRVPGHRGAFVEDLVGDPVDRVPGSDLAAFLAAPDAFMDRGETLKDDPPSRVVRLSLDGRDVVVKRFRHPGDWRALRRALRPSRARRSAEASALLEHAGLRVAPPIGWLEARRGPAVLGSWWLSGFVAGREAPAVLADAALDPVRRDALVGELARIVARLQHAGIAHGDLKATNLLVAEQGMPVLLDLHAARRVGVFGRHRLRRDLRRFRRNWVHDTALREAFDRALDAEGLPAL